jgi:signal transduction histidine kinase
MILLVVVLTVVWITFNFLVPIDKNGGDRSVFWVLFATGTMLLGGVLAGVIAYLTLTVKAINLNRRQSNFIDSVTHELKSPIASLKLYLQTLARRNVSEEQQQDFHRFMLEDVERLDSLINHLLDAARIEHGTKSVEDEWVRLDDLLRECASAACARHGVPVDTIEIRAPEITIEGRLFQLEILFRNLIDNGIKYGGMPPKVIVEAKPNDDQTVTVSIIDNGTGIPSNQRRKVFGRFVRLGSELERSKQGTGLGLYLVRNVTKALGGRILVRDRVGGSGTEFLVTLVRLVRNPPPTVE